MPGLQLETAIRYVRGVGPARSEQLSKAGIETVSDLLHLAPARYDVLPAYKPLAEWQEGQVACIAGEITQVRCGGGWAKPTIVVRVVDGDESCRITWFNSPYLRTRLNVGAFICATGKIQSGEDEAKMVNPLFDLSQDLEALSLPQQTRPQPIYSAIGMLDSKTLARTIRTCLAEVAWPDQDLPDRTRRRRKLTTLPEALTGIHQPQSLEQAARCRRRLAYDELLFWQLEFARSRRKRAQQTRAPILQSTPEIDRRIRKRLPFVLTRPQDKAIAEICSDLRARRPMFRLLQGDVGCGKTAVAVYAALVAVANRHQTAILSPTEVLALQHFEKMRGYLKDSAVRISFSSGASRPAARERLRCDLRSGSIDLVVGTHALLEPDVEFQRLGLVIVDEQHRFGVQQRRTLKSKGQSPHYLMLSATPIPRTQAHAIMGDLDISVIDTLPRGDRQVSTRVVAPPSVPQAWSIIRGALDRSERAYVVFPLVQESEKLPLRAVTSEYEKLCGGELNGYRCAMLHGKMTARDKQDVIRRFRDGQVQVLVCTTVIEVGVDVPEATVMVVFHAERFGLAQLHQLRGRVGRGGEQSYFLMFVENPGEATRGRLRVLETTTNGFEIAAADLQARGPGEVLGIQQHGLPSYKFANLATDLELLQAAQEDARAVLRGQIRLPGPDHDLLARFRRSTDMHDIHPVHAS